MRSRGVFVFMLVITIACYMVGVAHVLTSIQVDLMEKTTRIAKLDYIVVGKAERNWRTEAKLKQVIDRINELGCTQEDSRKVLYAISSVLFEMDSKVKMGEYNIDAIWTELIYVAKVLETCCDPWNTKDLEEYKGK